MVTTRSRGGSSQPPPGQDGRALRLYSEPNTCVIVAFQCSRCKWQYSIRRPKPLVIVYGEAMRAGRLFQRHRCGAYSQREEEHR